MNKFPRLHRLKSATEFKQVFRCAKRYSTQYITVYSCPNNLGFPRLGLSISKKHIRNATDRNRIKRVARETFRLNQTNLGNKDIVVVAYKGADSLSKPQQQQRFQDLWKRLSTQSKKTVIPADR
ncbi:MAG TPA: ribonuclease P protein component [Gammaproteobacteria bacterium]|nr:ribonuclease P protein component [Gammaproteobacteria bacterium]